MGKTVKIVLTPEQESWLEKHFKHTKNDDIARRLFNQYIQPDFDNLFTEKGRKEYDVAMYDNHQRDAQEWCRLQLIYLDRCWDNEENADKVTAFLEGLPSNNIFDKADIEHYRMKQ